jgi:hypothetical protein
MKLSAYRCGSVACGSRIQYDESPNGAEAVTVVPDVDPEVYRLGYGDFAAVLQESNDSMIIMTEQLASQYNLQMSKLALQLVRLFDEFQSRKKA